MAASASTRVQVNLKAFDTLVNVYADTPEELVTGLNTVQDNIEAISAIDALLKAAHTASPVTTAGYGQPLYETAQAPQASFSIPAPFTGDQGPSGPAGVAPSCQHGVRQYVAAIGKNGSPYKAWMCPTQQGDPSKCAPVWIK